jgi:hypothetical protein
MDAAGAGKFIQILGDIATPHATAVKQAVAWYRKYLRVRSS